MRQIVLAPSAEGREHENGPPAFPMARKSRIQVTELNERAKTTETVPGQYMALARWLLAHENGDQRGIEAMVEAAEVVCSKLRRHLGRRIGPVGFESLLSRAIHLSKGRFPFLDRVRPEPGGGRCLGGVPELVESSDSAEVGEGLATLFASLLFLLGQFVGDDMALRQVSRLWPEVPIWDAGPDPKEMGE